VVTLQIPKALWDEIVSHAQEEWPKECCGIVAVEDGHATRVYRTRNAAKSPNYGYIIDERDLFRIWDEIGDPEAFYHSHPKSQAEPSQQDINLAHWWPQALQLIVSLADRDNPEIRAFRIVDGKVDEAEVAIS
jgi:proteasome lid subunit RPN8/RPN11